MKRIFALLLALVMCLSLAACGGGDDDKTPSSSDTPPASSQQTPSSSSKPDAPSSTLDPASGEDIPTPEELNGWLATKTGKFYSQFTGGRMYMEYETEQEGMTMTVISATSGDKTYSETQMDGQSMGVSIIDGEDMYVIDHASKMIMKMSLQASGQEMMDTMLEEEDVDPANLVTGTREIDGKSYDTEEWVVGDGKSILCFDGDQLAYMIGEYEGIEMVIKVIKVSDQVDDSLFTLPEDYQMMSM